MNILAIVGESVSVVALMRLLSFFQVRPLFRNQSQSTNEVSASRKAERKLFGRWQQQQYVKKLLLSQSVFHILCSRKCLMLVMVMNFLIKCIFFVDRLGEPSLVLILKWGGELTPAGRIQAEELGRIFRCMYPGGQGRHLSGSYLKLLSLLLLTTKFFYRAKKFLRFVFFYCQAAYIYLYHYSWFLPVFRIRESRCWIIVPRS